MLPRRLALALSVAFLAAACSSPGADQPGDSTDAANIEPCDDAAVHVGNVLEDSGVPLLADADAPGQEQFAECPRG